MAKDIIVNYENKPCYNIKIRNNFSDIVEYIKEFRPNYYKRICIVSDDKVASFYLEEVQNQLGKEADLCISFVFPNGEASKNLSVVEKLYVELINSHFDRHDLLVALGGGVVGDLTGFTAATYLRGIDFIQVPTTLLSQVDSSIGGKTGVDYLQFKNMVGAFYMPKLVYINLSTLLTLPEEQIQSGMGEVIKHGCIRDESYFNYLQTHKEDILARNLACLEEVVYGSCQIKREVVELDPKEANIRGYLNYGHTIGHAVEKLCNFSLSHGACVAIGMVAASYLSMKKQEISVEDYHLIVNTIESYGLPSSVSNIKANDILAATKSDKKMVGNSIKFILLHSIGEAFIYTELSDDEILEGIEVICQ